MTIEEVNSSAIGRKVSCICSGFKRTGTIVSLVEDENTAGVHIKLDEPVFNATGYGVQHTEWYEYEFDSFGRKIDGFGNLENTKFISE